MILLMTRFTGAAAHGFTGQAWMVLTWRQFQVHVSPPPLNYMLYSRLHLFAVCTKLFALFSDSGMQGLTWDWITGNLYVVTSGGNIIACSTTLARSFICATVVTGQGDVEGLALNPTQG